MTSKIRIKMGPLEVDYEGSEEFLKQELPQLLSSLSTLYRDAGVQSSNRQENGAPAAPSDGDGAAIEGTTGTISAKLGVKSGPDLLLAACAHLTFVQKQDALKRLDILEAAKTATSYYTESVRKNLTAYLDNLVKAGKLIERSKDVYVLQAEARKALEGQLA